MMKVRTDYAAFLAAAVSVVFLAGAASSSVRKLHPSQALPPQIRHRTAESALINTQYQAAAL